MLKKTAQFHLFRLFSGKFRAGYSLIEVLVVVAIISISSTVALYQYTAYRNSIGVNTSATIIQRMMILAKNRAIASGINHELLIDLDAEVLWVDEVTGGARGRRKPRVIPNEAMVEDALIDEVKINGTSFTSGVQKVVFSPDGSNPLVTVLIRKATDDALLDSNYTSIRLYPSSSEPRIYEDQRK